MLKAAETMRPAFLAALSTAALCVGVTVPAVAQVATNPRATTAPSHAPVGSRIQLAASSIDPRRLSEGFVAVAERAGPSVVRIDVTTRSERAEALTQLLGDGAVDEPVARGMGSGIVFTADGAILTNNHVVEEALTINVRLRDGRYLLARLVGRDPATDLAVVKVDAGDLTPAKFADSEAAKVGEWVVAIGSPFGLNSSVTAGVLSAKGRGGLGMNAIEDYLQTDASINPGNSGGPLCNLQGEVLGVNTMIVGRGQGIGFAVPSSLARRVGAQILATGHASRPWLGVGIQDITPEIGAAMRLPPGAGALVNDVMANGPSFHANLRPGDVIAAVGGQAVHDAHDVIHETIAHDVGQPLALEVVRGGRRYEATVTLVERPDPPVPPIPAQVQPPPHQGLGLVLRDLAPDQASQLGLPARTFAVVAQVTAGSSAEREGMRPGDVVVEANGVADPTSGRVVDLARAGTLMLRVRRGQGFFYAALPR